MTSTPSGIRSPLSPEPSRGIPEALGQSEAFLDFQDRLSKIAPVNRPVLILGERGTGKELAAARLHFLSSRWQEPFITLNCSALSPSLIESELFGHERGAFTGATQQRAGRFELANQGTLFLDEIGNIPLEAQEKILRVVEYGRFERVGNSRSIEIDVRIIAATNVNLAKMAEESRFMKDLLDRLSFEVLHLPPLRSRREDILLLADHFAARMAFEMGRKGTPRFSPKAREALLTYPWPGNIRELKNAVERAVYRSDSLDIRTIVFNPFLDPYGSEDRTQPAEEKKELPRPQPGSAGIEEEGPFHEAVWAFKVKLLEEALGKAKFNQKVASEILGLTYHQFRALYRKYNGEVKGPATVGSKNPSGRKSGSALP